jgi:uncharacterized membrane protein YoaK (UPF0700 family)
VDSYFRDPRHGPLPALLLILTVATGLVDAVSILALGRVFVANMTGNIVFIGFGLARAPGFSLQASLLALAGFLIGAGLGGAAVTRWGGHRGVLLRNAAAGEVLLLAVAAAIVVSSAAPLAAPARDATVVAAAVALGLQNASVRKLAVPDLTTTVLTMTLTGIAAELRSPDRSIAVRRLLSVAAMLLGAACGALLVLHADVSWALFAATGLVLIVLLTAGRAARHPATWHRAQR